MGTILGGFTFWLTGGTTIFENIPESFRYLGQSEALGIPILSLLMVVLTTIFWFIMSLAALAEILMASCLGSAHPTGGDGLFLPAYAAAILGMTTFKEGVPNIWGTFVGARLSGLQPRVLSTSVWLRAIQASRNDSLR